jgi:DNA-binding PadR family transcriptional regulator
MSPRQIGYATLAVLQALADGHRYGFVISDRTGLASGTVYPALATLTRRGFVVSSWEDSETATSEARPRRRYYAVTPEGLEALKEARGRLAALGLAPPLRPGEGHG